VPCSTIAYQYDGDLSLPSAGVSTVTQERRGAILVFDRAFLMAALDGISRGRRSGGVDPNTTRDGEHHPRAGKNAMPNEPANDKTGPLAQRSWLDRLTRAIARIIATPPVHFIALLGLCAAYIQGGVTKLFDFNAAIAETQSFGLPFAPAATVATIVTELAASALILTGIYRWLGALWLAGFTLMATFVANRFWEMQPPQRLMVENSFFEHLGLVGGFLLVAWFDLRKRKDRSL
jgi:uncharacterized membrane protein YphA (DoxX/SURF4 family)